MKHLLETIRARGLDRITIAYTVAAWAVVQAAALAAGAFAWPQWVVQTAIVVALLGLPTALVSAWTLAVRKETGSIFRPSNSDVIVLGMFAGVLVIAGGVLVVVFWAGPGNHKFDSENVGPPAASVAVVPFANLSGDTNKRYLSDGISDELISELARVPSLRVAARSSSFAVAGKSLDARAIARALNVRAILEGSVQEVGNRVRIAAQLVNGRDGFQIWSQSYDRELTDILALQDDIASAVTEALSARLLPKARAGAIDAQAYRLYLQGKYYSAKANPDDLERAIGLFQKASAAAPRYAPAFAEAAAAQLELAEVYGKGNWLAPAEIAANRAHELDPENLQALVILSEIAIDNWKWAEAMELYRHARAINPTNINVVHLRSVLASIFQFPQEMLVAELKAVALNPLSLGLKLNIGNWYLAAGDYAKAASTIGQALRMQPTNVDARSQECLLAVRRRNLVEAQRLVRGLDAAYVKDPQNFGDCPFELALAKNKKEEARAIVERAAADFLANGGYATTVGDHYRQLGDYTTAMEWYERAYVNREVLLFGVPYERKPDRKFLSAPAWKALWNREPVQVWLAERAQFARTIVKPES